MTKAEEFEAVRPLLLSIARRILGGAGEAEDAVRRTGQRWAGTADRPLSVQGHLAAEVTRIATDALRAARLRQDPHADPWPAAPLPPGPAHEAELTDSLLTAALLVLERLSPLERAVFVLREMFGCGVEEIAAAVGCSPAACRQLVDAIAATSDGGRDPLPWPTYLAGSHRVARLFAAIVPPLARIGVTFEPREVAGRPGRILRDRRGTVLSAVALGVHEGRIEEIHLVVSPEPAAHPDLATGAYPGPVAEAYAILRGSSDARGPLW